MQKGFLNELELTGSELTSKDLLTLWANALKLFDYQSQLTEAFTNDSDREVCAVYTITFHIIAIECSWVSHFA